MESHCFQSPYDNDLERFFISDYANFLTFFFFFTNEPLTIWESMNIYCEWTSASTYQLEIEWKSEKNLFWPTFEMISRKAMARSSKMSPANGILNICCSYAMMRSKLICFPVEILMVVGNHLKIFRFPFSFTGLNFCALFLLSLANDHSNSVFFSVFCLENRIVFFRPRIYNV